MLGGLGAQELIPILVVILLLFGAKRIPEIARGLGKGIVDFKKALNAPEDQETQGGTLKEEEKSAS